jgi:hypothetical protein
MDQVSAWIRSHQEVIEWWATGGDESLFGWPA